jgi:hypothetical protein
VDAREVVDDAYGEDAGDVGGAAVAESCALGDEDVETLFVSPFYGVFDVAYVEVVGADFAG